MTCPNKNSPEWKALVNALGEESAMKVFVANNDNLPPLSEVNNYVQSLVNNIPNLTQTEYDAVEELNKYAKEVLPPSIHVTDIAQILSNLRANGQSLGTFRNNTIYLDRNADRSVGYHETFHAVFRSFLNDKQASEYIGIVRKNSKLTLQQVNDRINFMIRTYPASIKRLTRAQLEELVYEEVLADKFADWKTQGKPQPKNIIEKLFKYIQDFIDWLKGNEKLEALFSKIDRGGFRSSTIVSNKYNKIGSPFRNAPFKIIPGRNALDSQKIVNNIVATAIANKISINQSIRNYLAVHDPRTPANIEQIAKSKNPNELLNYLANEFGTISHPNAQKVIIEQANRIFQEMNYDPIQEDFVEVTEEEGDRNWDESPYEYSPLQRLSGELKRFMATTTFISDVYGKPIEMAINMPKVYYKTLSVLAGRPSSEIISTLRELGRYDEEVAAFTNKVIQETGWSEETPEGIGDGVYLMNRINKAYELEKVNFVSVVNNLTKNTLVTFTINKGDIGANTLNIWQNQWRAEEDKLLTDKAYQNEIYNSLDNAMSSMNKLFKTQVEGKINEDEITEVATGLKAILDKIGIEFQIDYLKFSLDLTKNIAIYKISIDDVRAIREAIANFINYKEDVFNPDFDADEGIYNRLKILATANVYFNDEFILHNYLGSDGKPRYTYTLPNMVFTETRELRQTYSSEDTVNKAIANESYLSYNAFLNKDVKDVVRLMSGLQVEYAGDFRTTTDLKDGEGNVYGELQEDGITFKDTDNKTLLLTIHGLFLGHNTPGMVRLVPFILADKSQLLSITVQRRNYFVNGEFTDLAKKDLWDMFVQEYRRIRGDFGNFPTKRFTNLPFFEGSALIDKIRSESDNYEKYKDEIMTSIESFFKAKGTQHLERLEEAGLTAKIADSVKEYGDFSNYVMNFVLNDFIYSNAYDQLIGGDLAIINESTYKKLAAQRVKRNSRYIAAGNTYNDHRVVYTNDNSGYVNKDTLETITDEEFDNTTDTVDEDGNVISKEGVWKAAKFDDGQVYSIVASKIKELQTHGRISDLKKRVEYSNGKVEYLSQLDLFKRFENPPIINGKPQFPTKFQMAAVGLDITTGIDLISSKQVTAGRDSEGNDIYHKMSVAYLSRKLNSRWDDKSKTYKPMMHRVELHNRMMFMENNHIDHMVPVSASKLFTGDKVDRSSFEKTSDVAHKAYDVNGKWRRLQVENNTKKKNEITFGTQMILLLDSELSDTPENFEIRQRFYNALAEVRDVRFQFALDQLATQLSEGNYEKKNDLTNFIRKVRDVIDSTTPDIQLYELLQDINGDFKYDLNLPHILSKIEQIYLSHFKYGFQHKISGRKLTLISAQGFKIIFNKVTGQVVTTEEYLAKPESYENNDNFGVRELKIHKIEGSNVQYGEVLIPRKAADLFGLKIGDEISPEMMKVIAARIPTQSYHSMGFYKIVDFLPDEYGDSIVAPKQIVYLSNCDYDVDSLFTYMKDYYIKDGKFRLYGSAQGIEEQWDEYKGWLLKNQAEIRLAIRTRLEGDPNYNLIKDKGGQSYEGADPEVFIDQIMSSVSDTAKDRQNKRAKEIFDRVSSEIMKEFNLPSTLDEYVAQGAPKSWGQMNNELLTSMEEIITRPELAEALKTPATDESIERNKNNIERLLPKDTTINLINGIDGKLEAFDNNMAGKRLVGISASLNAQSAFLTKHKVELNKAFHLTVDGVTYTGFGTEPKVTRHKADNLSTKVTATVDNNKKPMAGFFHWTRKNLASFALMNALGIDDSVDALLSVQPVMIELANKFTDAASPIFPTEAVSRIITNQIQTIEGIILGYKAKIDDVTDELSIEAMENSLKIAAIPQNERTNAQNIELYKNQLSALYFFKKLNYISGYVFHVGQALKLNRTIGTELAEIDNVKHSMVQLGVGDMVGESRLPTSKMRQLPFDIRSAFMTNSNVRSLLTNISRLSNVSKLFFLKQTKVFNDTYNRLLESLSPFINNEVRAKIKNDLLAYFGVMKLQEIAKQDFEKFNRLLYKTGNSKTITEQFFALFAKYPEFKANRMVRYLKAAYNNSEGNSTNMDLLTANTRNKLTRQNIELFIDSFAELVKSPIKEISDFTTTMMMYLIAKSELKFENNSFIKFVPANKFQALADGYKALLKQFNTASEAYHWDRYSSNSYEVSSAVDKRFSALFATLKDGRTIEEAYQIGVKGYGSVKEGKGKAPKTEMTREELYQQYKALWQQWASENPELIQDLAEKARGKVLTDKFATTQVSQARALADILNDMAGTVPNENFTAWQDQFIENYARNFFNLRNVNEFRTNRRFNKAGERPIEVYNVVFKTVNDKKQIDINLHDYIKTPADIGDCTLFNIQLKQSNKGLVVDKVIFPDFFKYDIGEYPMSYYEVYKLVKVTNTTAVYKPVTLFRIKNQAITHNSPKENERLNIVANAEKEVKTVGVSDISKMTDDQKAIANDFAKNTGNIVDPDLPDSSLYDMFENEC